MPLRLRAAVAAASRIWAKDIPLPFLLARTPLSDRVPGCTRIVTWSPSIAYSSVSPGLMRKALRIFPGIVVCPLLVTVECCIGITLAISSIPYLPLLDSRWQAPKYPASFRRGAAIEIGSVGSKGTRLTRLYDANHDGMNPNYREVDTFATNSASTYNALQGQARFSDWHRFSGFSAYVFSKSLDGASDGIDFNFATAASGLALQQALAQCPGCFSTQTPDVAQGNPGLGGGEPRVVQFAARLQF